MNLEGIKSALAKLPKWVKANPKKAAVIAVIVVIVAYFAIKRGATATGEGSADSATLDSAGGGLGSLESSGGGGSISTGGGSTGGAPGESITTTTTTDSGGGYAGSMDSFGIGSGADSFAYTAPAFSGSTASIMATANRGLSDVKKAAAPVTTPAPKNNNTLAAGLAQSFKVTAPAPVAAKVSNTLSPARAVAKSAPAKTAAELAGLPKFFTGVSGGRRYAAGLYIGNVAVAAPANKATAALNRK